MIRSNLQRNLKGPNSSAPFERRNRADSAQSNRRVEGGESARESIEEKDAKIRAEDAEVPRGGEDMA